MYDDMEAPSCCATTWRKARKCHRCVECRRIIDIGERYEYTSGVWDGTPASHRTCDRCVRVRDCHYAGMGALRECQCYTVGGLLGEIGELSREEPKYREAFRESYREAKGGA